MLSKSDGVELAEKIVDFALRRPLTAIGIAIVLDVMLVCLFVWWFVL